MTVSSSLSTQTFNCNGSTTVFTCPFRVLEASELVGYLITIATNESTPLVNGTDFAATGVGAANAVATTTLTYSSAYQVNFRRRTQRVQSTDYSDNDLFPAESHENALDRLTHIAQESDADIGRALLAPEPETGITLPAAVDRADRLLGFDSSGTPVALAPASGSAADLAIDLASTAIGTKNAGQIGYRYDLAYGHSTVGSKLRERRSILDFMTAAQRSDVEAGTLLVDCTVAMQAAFDSGEPLDGVVGSIRLDGNLSTNVVPNFIGRGKLTKFYSYSISGVALEIPNNAIGSFDDGIILRDFTLIGTGSGSTIGLRAEGVVWPTSVIQGVFIQSMGGAGLRLVDCISSTVQFCRAQQCGGGGFIVDQSNAIKLIGCSAESNGSHGYNFANTGIIGERIGCELINCLSEENTGDALRVNEHDSLSVIGGYYQVAALSSLDYAAIRLMSANNCSVIGAKIRTNQPFPLFSGVNLQGATQTKVIGNSFVKVGVGDGFDTGRDIVEDSTSNRNFFQGNTGGGAQGEASYTTSSVIGSYYANHAGSGGDYGMEQRAGYHTLRAKDATVLARFHPTQGVLLAQSGGKVAFYGGTPASKPSVSAAASDASSTEALANSLRAALIALNMVS